MYECIVAYSEIGQPVRDGCSLVRARPATMASGGLTRYFGNVRVVKAFDPVEGRIVMRADLYYREAQK